MIFRRRLLQTSLLSLAVPPEAWAQRRRAPGGWEEFLASVAAEARRAGVSATTVDRAFGGLRPNARVIELDNRQPEFTMTWARYKANAISDQRIAKGRGIYVQNRALMEAIGARFHVDPTMCAAIWGLESSFGTYTGTFNVIEALATLAFDGRRASLFRNQLIAALKILDHGDVAFNRMLGSYAGAMGQPQFMPDSYLRFAVDYSGKGRRDIWDDQSDVLASIANYLAKSGWRDGEPWGQPVRVTRDIAPGMVGRDRPRSLGEWMRAGVTRADGRPFSRADVTGALIMPDGTGGDAFMAYGNFNAVRRYNASDYYVLAAGILSDALA